MSHNITVEGGKSVRLKTAGKYCDRDIVVTAEGGGDTDAAFEAGRKAEYDAFWDAAQLSDGNPKTYLTYAFAGGTWEDANFRPKYDIKPNGNCASIFRQNRIVDLKGCLERSGVTLDFSKSHECYSRFWFH